MAEYRNIGLLNPAEGALAPNISINTERRGQVYQATHNGEGQTLPYMNRSFISFTYGGKRIEDFDLIATLSDRLDRDGYASFNDIVSDYENLDGLYYWSTHYKTNFLDFTLSTDGIDLKKLDMFLHWFLAGISRELILAEHPNRAIMARVADPPHLDLMPFESDVTIILSSVPYKTKTTLFKGDISLKLVMDLPHWYAITNVLGKKVTINNRTTYVDKWEDVTTGLTVNIIDSKDALKIIYEDGIPLGSMIDNNMLLGNGAFANIEHLLDACIWDPASGHPLGQARIYGTVTGNETPVSEYEVGSYTGYIAGAVVDANNNGIINLSPRNTEALGPYGYFFYSGTAPAPTIISFDLTPSFDNDNYIVVPYNSHTSTKYNTFTIESVTKQELYFTTPNVFTSYNKAIELFQTLTIQEGMDWETLREEIRDNVRHPIVRAWAIKCINDNCTTTDNDNIVETELNVSMKNTLISLMRLLFPATMPAVTFTFNSENGEATGKFSYKTSFSSENFTENIIEDVGDMLRSNYIILQDRNYPTSDGKIVSWRVEHPEYSHRIYHDIPNGLANIQILYKNMYL